MFDDVSIEHKDVSSLAVRASVGTLLFVRDRLMPTFQDGRRLPDSVLYLQSTNQRIDSIFSLLVKSSF